MDRKRDSFFLPNKHNKKQERPKQEYKNKRHEEFNKNRDVETEKTVESNKKPFDKKTYRLKKYSKKYKLEQWEDQRKKKLLRDYYKDTKDEPSSGSYKPKSFDEDNVDSSETKIGRFVRHPDINQEKNNSVQKIKKDPFQKAKERYNEIKQEKIDKRQLMGKAKEERQQKLQEYKQKKHERFKKLSKKTKKGQPVMTGRLEMLLEKIQNKST